MRNGSTLFFVGLVVTLVVAGGLYLPGIRYESLVAGDPPQNAVPFAARWLALLLHVACAAQLSVLARRWLHSDEAGLIAGLAWVAHPLQVASIAGSPRPEDFLSILLLLSAVDAVFGRDASNTRLLSFSAFARLAVAVYLRPAMWPLAALLAWRAPRSIEGFERLSWAAVALVGIVVDALRLPLWVSLGELGVGDRLASAWFVLGEVGRAVFSFGHRIALEPYRMDRSPQDLLVAGLWVLAVVVLFGICSRRRSSVWIWAWVTAASILPVCGLLPRGEAVVTDLDLALPVFAVGAAVLAALPRGRRTWVFLLAIVAWWSVQSAREVRSWSDPIQRFERDLADGRDSVGHHDLLSWAYAEGGNISPGLSHVNKALLYATNLPRLLVRKADLLARAGNSEAAIQTLNRAEKIDPTTHGLYPVYVRILVARGDFESAGRSLLRARALEPDDARLALEFAWVLRRMGRPEAALDAATEALALDPRLPGARAEMAWARSMIDSTDRQREETLRLARSDLGQDAKVQMRTWATLARLHAARGHHDLSVAASSRAESLAVALGSVEELREWTGRDAPYTSQD